MPKCLRVCRPIYIPPHGASVYLSTPALPLQLQLAEYLRAPVRAPTSQEVKPSRHHPCCQNTAPHIQFVSRLIQAPTSSAGLRFALIYGLAGSKALQQAIQDQSPAILDRHEMTIFKILPQSDQPDARSLDCTISRWTVIPGFPAETGIAIGEARKPRRQSTSNQNRHRRSSNSNFFPSLISSRRSHLLVAQSVGLVAHPF